jgi:hypothetical protein
MQPFGGARGSGTNDKGIYAKLIALDIGKNHQRNFVTPIDYRYPF